MSTEIILFIIIVIFFVFIIWRLNTTKTKQSVINKNTRVSNKARSFNDNADSIINKQDVNEDTFLFVNISVEQDFLDDFSRFFLFTENLISSENKQTIDNIVNSFRKPHPLLFSLTQGVFEPNELFDLIKTDPEMTAKVLEVVNSPLFSLRQPITSINHAIIFLGVTSVKNIVMQLAIQTAMNEQDSNQEAAYQKLWIASSIASSLCLLIAKQLGRDNPAELSTYCLLSYLGDMAIVSYEKSTAAHYISEEFFYRRIDKVQNLTHINSALVGKVIAQKWQLPTSIVQGIEHSLLPLTFNSNVNDISDEKMGDILICYISCRIGELVAFNKMTDISQLEALLHIPEQGINFYSIKNEIEKYGLGQLNTLFSDPTFKRKVNKII